MRWYQRSELFCPILICVVIFSRKHKRKSHVCRFPLTRLLLSTNVTAIRTFYPTSFVYLPQKHVQLFGSSVQCDHLAEFYNRASFATVLSRSTTQLHGSKCTGTHRIHASVYPRYSSDPYKFCPGTKLYRTI